MLPLTAMTAAELAASWKVLYRRMLAAHPLLLIPIKADAHDWSVQPASFGNGLVAYNRKDTAPPAGLTHCAAISCIGFRGENTTVPSTTGTAVTGPAFWEHDDFEEVHLGTQRTAVATSEGTRLHALVSGGGDGAMQDFVRIATGKMGKKLYEFMMPAGLERLPEMTELLLAEDFARRAHTWRPAPQATHAFRRWHAAYEAVVERVWKHWVDKKMIDAMCARVLRPNVSVTWVVGGEVPGYAYGLNRLLAALVARLIHHRGGRPLADSARRRGDPEPECRPVIITKLKLKSLAAIDGHQCDRTCFAKRHKALLQMDLNVPSPNDYETGFFDLVVIRHGVDQRPYFGGAMVSEQTMPFSFPQ